MSSPFRSAHVSSAKGTSRFFTEHRRLELARSFARQPMRKGGRAVVATASLVGVLLALSVSVANAQQCRSADAVSASTHVWTSPLDRRVSLHTRDASLRDALDLIAGGSRVKLSYASESIPVDS